MLASELFDQMLEGVGIYAPNGDIVYVNGVAAAKLGRARETLIGENLWALFPPDVRHLFRQAFQRTAQTGEAERQDEWEPESGACWENSLFRSAERVVCIARDVTKERAAERGAARAVPRGAIPRDEEFLAMLGHELRNPLAPILTALELMKLRGTDAEAERALIERQVRRLVHVVDDLLDISRMRSGQLVLQKAPTEVAPVVAAAVRAVRPLLEQRGSQLSIFVPPEGVEVDADVERLAQVFTNLLANAVKFSRPGGRIGVVAQRRGRSVAIAIADDGVGIAPELLARLFVPFVQGPQSSARTESGLGLGLALVRSIVELHGGHVSATSGGPGKGSVFEVELPLTQEPMTRSPSVSADPAATPIRNVSPKRILVVDDNVDAADLLAEVLRTKGYVVVVAHDGPSALLEADALPPDVAVLDIGLPVMDGYELARRLHSKLPGLRLVAVTGYGQESDRARAFDAGFDVHLVKPVDFDTLVEAFDGA